MDSDDYLDKNIIKLLVQNAISECADCVAAGFEQVSEAGNVKGKSIPVSTVKCSGIDALRLHYQDKAEGLLLAYVTGRLYKKSIFDEIRFMPNIFYEDVSIMPRILLNSKKLVYLPIIGYHYVIREQSVSHSEKNFLKLYKDSFEIWEDHMQLYKNHNLTEFERYISLLVCEKIVAHGEKKMIPEIYYEQSIKLLKGNLFMAMKANIPIKRKIRLLVYSIKQCVNKR